MSNTKSKKYIVSACLAGTNCRYDGANKYHQKIVDLINNGQAVAVCPEELGGLPTPRPPAEFKDGKYLTIEGNDVTLNFKNGAQLGLEVAKQHQCSQAILKSCSPMCGHGEIYDGNFSGTKIQGHGEFANTLLSHGLEVITEDDLEL